MNFYEFTEIVKRDLARASALVAEDPNLVNLRDPHVGMTPLHYMAVDDKREAVLWLIGHGADVNTVNNFKGTPLHDAATLGYFEMCRLLLEHGARTDMMDDIGLTPLSIAVRDGYAEIFEMLLAKSPGDINDYFDNVEANLVFMSPDSDLKKKVIQLGLKKRYE